MAKPSGAPQQPEEAMTAEPGPAAVDPQRNNWWNLKAMALDKTGAPKDYAQSSDVNDSWKDDRYGD
jgi:hypothetical protein